MSKYYKVIKDHPMWEVGAILKQDTNNRYSPINDLFIRELPGEWQLSESWYEDGKLVENQPEWFARVYEISTLGKTKYLMKEAARKVHEELYREK